MNLLVWAIPAIVPLAMVLFAFFFQDWSWGLMDDAHILNMGQGIVEKFLSYFTELCQWGVFRPTFVAHSAFFYTIFAKGPQLFHLVKWLEVVLLLGIWGRLTVRITNEKKAFFVFSAVTLSFHYLYDQLFFLSTQEVLGLIFLGLALSTALGLWEMKASFSRRAVLVVIMIVFLLLSFGAKEPMLAGGIALGFSFVLLFFLTPKKNPSWLAVGVLLLVFSGFFAMGLKFWIKGNYTSAYSFADSARFLANLRSWAKKDLLNHLPWIFGVVILAANVLRQPGYARFAKTYSFKERGALVLGVFLYGGYLLILLPWNPTSYYAAPLGVFFGFMVAVGATRILVKVSPRLEASCLVGALVLNMFICQYALTREALYHYDTQNLMAWVSGNKDFQQADRDDKVFCNAMEAARAMPSLLNISAPLALKNFLYQPDMPVDAGPGELRYFVYCPRFGKVAEQVWAGKDIVFYSRYWQVYLQKNGG